METCLQNKLDLADLNVSKEMQIVQVNRSTYTFQRWDGSRLLSILAPVNIGNLNINTGKTLLLKTIVN